MRAADIEIPYVQDRGKRYRFFEMLPGLLSWTILILPFALSPFIPEVVVVIMIAYLLMWFIKSIALDIRFVQGYRAMRLHTKLDWAPMLEDVENVSVAADQVFPAWHTENILRLRENPCPVKPSELLHVVIIATYKESREVLEPTIQAVLDSNYDMKRVMLVIAYEERGGPEVAERADELIKDFGHHFWAAMTIGHPADIPGEIIGKGGNITFAAREVEKYLEKQKIDPLRVVVTTLDSDNRPHKSYLAAVSYTYCLCPDPKVVSFQPITLYTNNIWDAPAPMRVVATGNSFWQTVQTFRPHVLRNFSAHSQSMKALIDTDFWSVRTIVEDGHQFWRTYFRYDGNHEVYPIFTPVYQDAVFVGGYIKTLKAQFVQVRRWAWGASDVAYVVEVGFFRGSKVPRAKLWAKLLRLLDGHVSWATGAFLIAFGALIPSLFNPRNYSANSLPIIASRIETLALVSILFTLFFSLKTLPPKPLRYKRHRTFIMVIQWFYLPVTTVVYGAAAALYSQTRLIFGKYIGKFDVTEKAVKTSDNKTVV